MILTVLIAVLFLTSCLNYKPYEAPEEQEELDLIDEIAAIEEELGIEEELEEEIEEELEEEIEEIEEEIEITVPLEEEIDRSQLQKIKVDSR